MKKIFLSVMLNLFQHLPETRSRIKSGMTKERGFTLIELLIVIVVIGILASLLMANFLGVRQKARDGQRKSDIKQIQTAMELYRADIGTYPCFASCGWAIASSMALLMPTYMQIIPNDPITGAACPGYLIATNGTNYAIYAVLENTNDEAVRSTKPVSGYAPPGTYQTVSGQANARFTVSGGSCSGTQYNYWVVNP